jgi:hypothetical protein
VARRKVHRSLCCNPCRIHDLNYLWAKIPHSATVPILFRFGGLWCEYALHGGIHPQLCCVKKRILSCLSFRQLLCLTGARICLLVQMVRRQKCYLVPVAHAGPHFGEYKLQSNQSSGSDRDGLDTTCICWMWPHRVQRSVQCSYPGREGVMRCTMVTPRQRSHRELDRTRGGEGATSANIFNLS